MARGGTRRGGARRGRGRGAHPREETVEMTAESTHNGGQAPIQGVDPAVITAAVVEGLRQLFGQQIPAIPVGGQMPGVAAAQAQGAPPPPVIPPPPPPVQMPNQDLRHDYWKVLKLMREMGTTTFNGETDPVVADNWKKQLERNFGNVRCPPEYKVELATSFLLGEAQIWWDEFVRGGQPGYIVPWTTFREEFDRKYFPQEALDQLEMEFLSLTQENRSVRDYEREFNRLKRFSGREMNEQFKIKKFMMGLRLDIRKICQIRDYGSLIDLVERASLTERNIEEENKLTKSAPQKSARTTEPVRHQQDSRGVIAGRDKGAACSRCGKNHSGTCMSSTGLCYNCGQPGHTKVTCRKFMGTCNSCGKVGHRAKDCRVRQHGQIIGNQNREQLPPPPKRQTVAPRAYVAGDHKGNEPIAGMFTLPSFP